MPIGKFVCNITILLLNILGWADSSPTIVPPFFYGLGWPSHLGQTQPGWVRPTTAHKHGPIFLCVLDWTRPNGMAWAEMGLAYHYF